MSGEQFFAARRQVDTPSGSISYVEHALYPTRVRSLVLTCRKHWVWRMSIRSAYLTIPSRLICGHTCARRSVYITWSGSLMRSTGRHTVDIEAALKLVHAPTLIAWGTDDIFFDLKWSYWLENTIAGSRRRMEITGGRIFFPEARASEFNEAVRTHWLSISEPPTR